MNRTLYTLYLYLLSPAIWLYFLYRGFKDRGYWQNLSQRLGIVVNRPTEQGIHVHCASVGETKAAIPLIKKLSLEYPNDSLTITTTTPTGKAEVLKLISELGHPSTTHCYLPIDWPGSCRRFIEKLRPKISILMETELWPNLVHQLSNANIPVLLANARLSNTSLKKYQKHLKLSKQIFASIHSIAAQYQVDSQNFQSLEVPSNKIHLVGNIKFDIQLPDQLLTEQRSLKQAWANNRPSWIAASIHPAEFGDILDTHQRLLTAYPDLLLIAVPRHPECFEQLKLLCEKMDLSYVNRSSDIPPTKEHSVLVGDSMGELTLMCGVADIAYVGGSLIERGGHNPLEPAACGLPVIMGPSDYNFSDVCEIMRQQGVLQRIEDSSQLFKAIDQLLSDPKSLAEKSKNTVKVFDSNRGAVDKIMKRIEELIGC